MFAIIVQLISICLCSKEEVKRHKDNGTSRVGDSKTVRIKMY